MATISITSLGLRNADLTAIGKLSGTGLSQIEVADAVVEGDKLKKGNKIVAYDGHLASTSNPHGTTANQVGAYSKTEVDNLLTNTETLLLNKVDKVTGKGLSTNDFTDTFKQALELKKVQDISTDSVAKKLVVNYTDSTVANLNINDIITDVHVSGATLDATTNVLTLTSDDGGADVTVNLSDFVNSSELTSALANHYTKTESNTNFEPKNANIQSHISSTSNPHSVTASQVGAYTIAQTDTAISTAISSLIDSSPTALDTLNELAAALGDDPNFATTVATSIGTKVDKVLGKELSDNNYSDLDVLEVAKIANKVDKVVGSSLVPNSKVSLYDSHLIDETNPHNTTASQVGAYSKAEVDNLLANVDLTDYYDKTETETLLSGKIDKGTEIVGATKTKITYNNDGIITGGADLDEADLPSISQAKVTNLVSDLNSKQSMLISGTNIKTINGQSVLGSGDIEITGDIGKGVVNILFTSTTNPSGLVGQSGATDTYTITYSDNTTDIIKTYNGLDGGVQSAEVDAKINAKHSTAYLMAYSN